MVGCGHPKTHFFSGLSIIDQVPRVVMVLPASKAVRASVAPSSVASMVAQRRVLAATSAAQVAFSGLASSVEYKARPCVIQPPI